MKYLSIGFLLVASTAFAQPIRFTGSGIGDTNYGSVYDPATGTSRYDVGGSITFEGEYANDITLPLENPTWDFDISTDGQSVTIHDMTVSYSDTLYINPLVWLEISVEATIADTTVDVNPSTSTVWTVQEHSFTSMDVSGVYHGIGLTQPFSGSLPDATYSYDSHERGLLDFADWPNELAWEAGIQDCCNGVSNSREIRRFSASSSSGWIGVEPYLHIRQIQVWEPVSVVLTPLVPSADFDSDNAVDGADFLTWQRGHGITSGATHAMGDANCDGAVGWSDMEVWLSQYGSSAPLLEASSIPEPTTFALALATLWLVVGRRPI